MRYKQSAAVWCGVMLACVSTQISRGWEVTTLTPDVNITGSISFVVREINTYGTSNEWLVFSLTDAPPHRCSTFPPLEKHTWVKMAIIHRRLHFTRRLVCGKGA